MIGGEAPVLIVDDDPLARELLTAVLAGCGVSRVLSAGDGEAALAVLAQATPPPALIISDIDMPRLDGWSLARRVRMGAVEACREVPIVMLTANNSDRNQQKAAIHKITAYLVKPPTPDAVKGILSSL
ncbi:two-component system, chemotaxis family, response regulator CheY/two-component system, chemotaxis family, sensor histidine kinase and response regulator WspE [Roseospirillum parvum]|uniref:Two-component system, chemotaxis family, response regulator CheY/two-component system, chemotaxis family, sensor histidine kinase and response regulator WspE n=2 Tax=Roseospirillum parvum TaxID=83401 RepID=A0A1G7X2R5_9PROT|nr:two-component system, chemotaxis family, response regulator CheY/two-component system, chemotaxis family, sensor histidine kinase and response regulator WspE [Roseospirillum parvum]